MSGRIRTIKPELLEDAVTAGLSDVAFRLFIACILLADDYGNLRFEPEWIRGQVYWKRSVDSEQFSSAFAELAAVITSYEVKGQRYGAIKNWAKHQKVSHPGKPRVPSLADALPRVSGEPHETLVPDLRSPTTTTDHIPTTAVARERADVPDPIGPEPVWWQAALETVGAATTVDLPPREAWLRYAGHRNNKRLPATQPDAVQWLTAVMVREARDARERARQQADRDAKYDKARAGPAPPNEPTKLTQAEQKRFAEQLRQRMQRKGVA